MARQSIGTKVNTYDTNQTVTLKGTDTHVSRFDSQADFKDALNVWHGDCDGQWVGATLPTIKDGEKHLNTKWEEGMKVFQSYVNELVAMELPELKDTRRQVRFSEDGGDEVDLDRLRDGQPYWRETVREDHTGSRTVTIMAHCGGHCGIAHMDLLWRGAAAVALAYILESKGYQVELWSVWKNTKWTQGATRDEQMLTGVKLKECGDPMDVSTFVNTMSGWFHRTFYFSWIDTLSRTRGRYSTGTLGTPTTPTMKELRHFTTDENAIFMAAFFGRRDAMAALKGELERIIESHAV